jgi:hypothetical protein
MAFCNLLSSLSLSRSSVLLSSLSLSRSSLLLSSRSLSRVGALYSQSAESEGREKAVRMEAGMGSITPTLQFLTPPANGSIPRFRIMNPDGSILPGAITPQVSLSLSLSLSLACSLALSLSLSLSLSA